MLEAKFETILKVKITETCCLSMLRKCLPNLLSMVEMILNVVWVGLNMELHLSCINPLHGIDLFLYPLKTSNTSGFLMISGGIEMEYCCLK